MSAASASVLAGASNESERYLFYRGLGRLDLPVRVEVSTEQVVVVHNVGEETIPAAFVLDVGADGKGRFLSLGSLAGPSNKVHLWQDAKPRDISQSLDLSAFQAGKRGKRLITADVFEFLGM